MSAVLERIGKAENFASWSFEALEMPEGGPWKDEPDKVQWVDPKTDLDCLVVRNRGGALCGYVGVGPDHPLHGQDYSSDVMWPLEVHGGLTFANHCADGEPVEGICHRAAPGRPDPVWWLGFDCAHLMDLSPIYDGVTRGYGGSSRKADYGEEYRDLEYVVGECEGLAAQLTR